LFASLAQSSSPPNWVSKLTAIEGNWRREDRFSYN
jgi:hypothetical protein